MTWYDTRSQVNLYNQDIPTAYVPHCFAIPCHQLVPNSTVRSLIASCVTSLCLRDIYDTLYRYQTNIPKLIYPGITFLKVAQILL